MRTMVIREQPQSISSPKTVVGEIDTSAPFQSVKHAVSLFGNGSLSGEKPTIKIVKPRSAEKVLAKDTQFHFAEKELKKLKDRIKNAENTKAEALVELERAMRTVEGLTEKLKTINEAKEAALKATEAAKIQAKQLEEENNGSITLNNAEQLQDFECARQEYMNVLEELNAAKQELAKICQHYDASSEAKIIAFKKVEEAEHAARENGERTRELSEEISALKETIDQVEHTTMEAKRELTNVFEEKEVQRQTYTAELQESENKLKEMKKKFDRELIEHLETQLVEKTREICMLQKEMEESGLHQLVGSLKLELETLKKENAQLREKEVEIESVVGNLHVKLRKSKSELEICVAEGAKARGASDEMITTLNQLSTEAEKARREAEVLKMKADELEKEAETTRASLQEAEKFLNSALEETEKAKADEESALAEIKIISERTNKSRLSTSESNAKIIVSRDEFESLSRKTDESGKLTELKVDAIEAQAEAVKASENEALKKLQATQKEIEDIKTATNEALKKAEMASAAKKAVEGELRRWREREQKKAAEIASRILTETQVAQANSPVYLKLQNQKSELTMANKVEKQRNSVSKKTMMPSLSGIFHRKKTQIDISSPSYLPGESPF